MPWYHFADQGLTSGRDREALADCRPEVPGLRAAVPCKTRMDQKPFRQAVIRLASGTAASQVLAFLLTPVLSRRFAPEAFGVYAAQFALAALIATIATGRYEEAVPLPESDDEGVVLSRAAKWLAFLLCTGLSMCLAVVPSVWLAELANTSRLEVCLTVWVTALTLAWLATDKMWALRMKAYRLVSIGTVAQGFGTVALQCLASLFVSGYRGLVWGQLAALFVSLAILNCLPAAQRAGARGRSSLGEIWRVALVHKDFVRFSSIGAVLDRVSTNVLPWVILHGYGTAAAGVFSFTNRLILAPVQLVSSSVSFAYYSHCGGRPDSVPYARKLYSLLLGRLAVGGVLFLGIGVGVSFFVSTIFGPEWRAAEWAWAWLTLGAAGQLVVAPLGGSVTLCGRQDVFAVRELVRAVMIVSSVPLALALALSERQYWTVLGMLTMISYAVYGLGSLYAFRHPRRSPNSPKTLAETSEER